MIHTRFYDRFSFGSGYPKKPKQQMADLRTLLAEFSPEYARHNLNVLLVPAFVTYAEMSLFPSSVPIVLILL
jgi:hypothetical protein